MTTTKTFKCAVSSSDILTAFKDSDRRICIEISGGRGYQKKNVLLTKKQVKKLRKVLKKCLKSKGE